MMNVKLSQQKFTIDNNNCSKLHYQLIQMKFLNHLEDKKLSFSYISICKRTIAKVTKYIKKDGINYISKLSNKNILDYILKLNHYSQGTKYGIASKLRIFFRFMYVNKFTTKDFSLVIPQMKINHNNKISRTILSTDEINKTIKAIDTSAKFGKRDYAIILLLAKLGLRFSDIKNLKFENINWQMNIINVVQHKTKKIVTLPLLENIGTAIIEYIKNGRPNVDSEYIFLNDSNTKFSDKESFSHVVKKYLKLANIDISGKKYIGTYSLRHSLASSLLQKRIPLSTISSILGHSDINNTAIYLKIDIESLRECCLDLEVS